MAGLTLRNYGFFVSNRPLKEVAGGIQVQAVRDPILNRDTDLLYRGYDPAYPDTDRARAFLAELAEFEKTGRMPQLMMLRLAGDRDSAGATDNDAALGMIVEGLTRSRFWQSIAVFVVAAEGKDRVPALVDLALRQTRSGRPGRVQRPLRAADHRADPGAAAHHHLRCGRADARSGFPDGAQPAPVPGGSPIALHA